MNELIWPCPFCSLLCEEHLISDLQGKFKGIETFECDKSKDSLSNFIDINKKVLLIHSNPINDLFQTIPTRRFLRNMQKK